MQVSEVTSQDGRMCAQLLNLLKAGKWELSGPDISAHAHTVLWVQQIAQKMAEQLQVTTKTTAMEKPTANQMRIKKMGPLPGSHTKTSNSKSK